MKEKDLEAQKMSTVAFILKTIGHPIRIGIIQLLTQHIELPVNKLCENLKVEQSVMSHHLSNMKFKGILGSRREGKQRYYFIKLQEVKKVIECMEKCDLSHL